MAGLVAPDALAAIRGVFSNMEDAEFDALPLNGLAQRLSRELRVNIGTKLRFDDEGEVVGGEQTMWARLFGRHLGGTPDDKVLTGGAKPKTHADLLHRSQATAHRAVKGDKVAIAQRKQPPVAGSLARALGLS